MDSQINVEPKKNWLKILVCIIVFLILVVTILYLVLKNKNLENELDKIGSSTTAIATATAITSKTITQSAVSASTETSSPSKSDEELIKEALAGRLSQEAANLTVSIDKKSEAAAFGTAGVTGEIGGGWFVASKQGDEWIIIADGNGTIECSVLDEYDIPASVVGECYNSTTDESITR